jgi:hypothetical protein
MLEQWSNHIDWFYMLPPGRPSPNQISKLSELISANNPKHIAILGSTLEFRDLCASYGIPNVHIIDRSQQFHNSLKEYIGHDVSNEELILCDWISYFSKMNSKYDFILSDLTSGNIPYEQHDAFYKYISCSLKPNGLFFDKLLRPKIYYNLDYLDSLFRPLAINISTLCRFCNMYFFCSELVESAKVVEVNEIREFLKERYFSKNLKLFRLVELSERILPKNGRWYYGEKNDLLDTIFYRWFSPVELISRLDSDEFEGQVELRICRKVKKNETRFILNNSR